jgi:hypothetical protein
MAKEPDDLVLRLLREIRTKQDLQGSTLDSVQKRVEDLYKMSTTRCRRTRWASRLAPMSDTKNLKRRFTSFPTASDVSKQRPS